MAGNRCHQTFEVDNARQLPGQIESFSCSEMIKKFLKCNNLQTHQCLGTLTKTCRMGRWGLRPRSISYTRKVKTKQLNSHTSCHVAGATYLNDAVWELNVSHSCWCKRTFNGRNWRPESCWFACSNISRQRRSKDRSRDCHFAITWHPALHVVPYDHGEEKAKG